MSEVEFSKNLQQTFDRLRPFAHRLTKNSEDTEDLLQDTMLKAYVNRYMFHSGTSLCAWLYTIMRNTFLNTYRHRKRRADIQHTLPMHCISNIGTIDDLVDASFVAYDLQKALSILSGTLRRPFLMHTHGFKYREIAKTLHLPMGTVKSHIHLARKHLQVTLQPYGGSM